MIRFASAPVCQPSPEHPFHAWFSLSAARFAGSGIWQRPNGDEVEVTLADPDRAAEWVYGWVDSVYVGLVVKRLRAGRKGNWNPPPIDAHYADLYP